MPGFMAPIRASSAGLRWGSDWPSAGLSTPDRQAALPPSDGVFKMTGYVPPFANDPAQPVWGRSSQVIPERLG